MGILTALRKFHRTREESGFHFGRPLVLLQSDDWGRVGVRDQEGLEELRANGLKLGEDPYDLYSLETCDDVAAIAEVLHGIRDSVDHPARLEMNFVMANVDFEKSAPETGNISLKPLTAGLPGKWHRPGLFEAYCAGIQSHVFSPALHGASHFCQQAMTEILAERDERADIVRTLWAAHTPYIYSRMRWAGFEYWDPNRQPAKRFLSQTEQQRWISFAAETFEKFFQCRAVSACAPGYRANRMTARCWHSEGVRIAQNGPGRMRAPHFDELGLLHTYRSIDFEPALNHELRCDDLLAKARNWFAAGLPFIISVHSVNFHSTLAPYRQRTLPLLSELLQGLKRNFPDILFVDSQSLLHIIETGRSDSAPGTIQVEVRNSGAGVRV